MYTTTISTNIKGYTTFAIASLFLLQCGCAAVPPSTQHQASVRTLAIIAANQDPEIRFEGFSRSKDEGALGAMPSLSI
jgi:hypothetical protein